MSHNARAHHNYGLALAEAGARDQAIPYLRAGIALRPDDERPGLMALLYRDLAGVLGEHGDIDAALEVYDQALGLTPGSAELWARSGFALSRLGRLDEAIQRYREATRLRPEYASAYSSMGNALALQNHWDSKVECGHTLCTQ